MKVDERAGGTPRSQWVGIAPHSVRAVPLAYLKEIVSYGNEKQLPIHMHVASRLLRCLPAFIIRQIAGGFALERGTP